MEQKKRNYKKEFEKLEKKLVKCNEENVVLNDKLLRLSADLQNYRKRKDEEIQNLFKYENEEMILSVLPIIDNFERAIKLDDNNLEDELSKFLEGFKMIYSNLLSVLNSYEVKEIEAQHKEFDSKYHHAVLMDCFEEYEDNIIIEVLQKGYFYKDKVIRPSMVKVNKKGEDKNE